MKKLFMMMLLILLLSGCSSEISTDSEGESVVEVSQNAQEDEQAVEASYQLKVVSYIEDNQSVAIDYLVMTDYVGELTQDYINQSLYKVVELYSHNDFYSKVSVTPRITMMTDQRLSIVYEGNVELDGGKKSEVLLPVTIDMATSNEITFDNLFNDGEAVRKIVGQAVVTKGLSDVFEAEGIRIYLEESGVTFAYMPLDDSATSFIQVTIPVTELVDYMNDDFGDHPAS